jgi:hypothetical protein
LSAAPLGAEAVQALEVGMQFIGPSKTSFPKLLYVQINNPGYIPVNLGKIVSESELLIDGKPSKRKPKPFFGPQGLAPMAEWRGCFAMNDYEPMITPGRHKVALRLSGMQSSDVKVNWTEPVSWKKGTMKSRMKEIHKLALAIEESLPQSCVEQWLTRKDGGIQDEGKIRYVLEPHFKVSVPYRKAYNASVYNSVVDGTPIIYQEQPVH